METIVILLAALALVALVGHALWLVAAAVLRVLSGRPVRRGGEPLRKCPSCSHDNPIGGVYCTRCGCVLSAGPEADECADLDAFARQLGRFVASGIVADNAAQTLRAAVDARRNQLSAAGQPATGQPKSEAAPATGAPSHAALDPVASIGQLLSTAGGSSQLSDTDRAQVLKLFDAVDPDQLRRLTAAARFDLAGVLGSADRADDALAAYEQLIRDYRQHPAMSRAALAAGQFAARCGRYERARSLLRQAVEASTNPDEKRAAERALTDLPVEATPVPAFAPVSSPVTARPPAPPRGGVETDAEPATTARETAPVAAVQAPPAQPKPRRRTAGEMLAAFLEEKNIRWGELVGGLLIVGCSVALVISQWERLARVPSFQFLVFVGATSAIFAAGLYTLHRWNLQSTSRGVLLVGMLLVPLNFLAMASLARGQADVVYAVATQVIAFAVLGALVWKASGVLLPDADRLATGAILGTSACVLLAPWMPDLTTRVWLFHSIAGLATAAYVLPVVAAQHRWSRAMPVDGRTIAELFMLLGLAAFGAAMALGWLATTGDSVPLALDRLALWVAVGSAPVVLVGTAVHCRATDSDVAPYRVAGTAIGLGGMLALPLALGMAWPQPDALIATGLCGFAALTYVALRFELPAAHAVALPCLAATYGATTFLVIGDGSIHGAPAELHSALVEFLRSSTNGQSLVGLVLFLGIGTELLVRRVSRAHALFYAGASGVVALASLSIVGIAGLRDPVAAAVICAAYGAACLVLNARLRLPALSHVGLALLVAASGWAMWNAESEINPRWIGVAGALSLLLAAAAGVVVLSTSQNIARRGNDGTLDTSKSDRLDWLDAIYVRPMAVVANGVSVLTIAGGGYFLIVLDEPRWRPEYALAAACLTIAHLLLSAVVQSAWHTRVAGAIMLAAAALMAAWLTPTGADVQAEVALAIAIGGVVAALMVLGAKTIPGDQADSGGSSTRSTAHWYRSMAPAWLETAAVGTALAAATCVTAPTLQLAGHGENTITGALVALATILLARAYHVPTLAWIGSAAALATTMHALAVNLPRAEIAHPLVVAALVHASLAVIVAIAWDVWQRRRGAISADPHDALTGWRADVMLPLERSALVSALLAVPLGWVAAAGALAELTIEASWLSAILLVLASRWREQSLFAAFQAAMATTAILGAATWLQSQPWNLPGGIEPSDPRNWQAFVVAVGAFALFWGVVRAAARRMAVHSLFLDAPVPAVDRFARVLAVGVFTSIVVLAALPGIAAEFSAAGGTTPNAIGGLWEHAFSPGGWIAAAVLAASLAAAMWDRWRLAEALAAVVLGAATTALAAAPFTQELATASALRFASAGSLLVISAIVWSRAPLAAAAERLGCRFECRPHAAWWAHGTLLVTSLMPLLALSTIVAAVAFAGHVPAGPAATSVFAELGFEISNLLPLAVAVVALTGTAARESSPGYAFGGGLVATATVAGGYMLTRDTTGAAEWVVVLQLATFTAAAWAIAWQASRPWVRAWREVPESPLARPLMTVQIGFGSLGNALLLVLGLTGVVVPTVFGLDTLAATVGSTLGWLTLAAAVGAALGSARQRRSRLLPDAAGLAGMASIGLLACSIAGYAADWGLRALVLGWGAYALAVVLSTWWIAANSSVAVGERLMRAAAIWVTVPALATLALTFRAIPFDEDQLWAAAGLACASAGSATMAVWRRREPWALAAGFGLHLAASVVVWHQRLGLPFDSWWVLLVEANLIASGAISLLWLGARRRLYEHAEIQFRSSPLLATQLGLGLTGVLVLLVPAVAAVAAAPETAGALVPLAEVGHPAGWLGTLLVTAAAAWYLWETWRPGAIHASGGALLAIGCLAASAAAPVTIDTDWFAYHVLMSVWAAAGVAMLAIGMNVIDDALRSRPSGWRTYLANALQQGGFVLQHAEVWILAFGALSAALACRGTWDDPLGPYWPASTLLVVSAMAGMLGVRRGRWAYVYASGLLVNVAGSVIWLDGTTATGIDWVGFVYLNAACAAATSVVWTLIERVGHGKVPAPAVSASVVPLAHAEVIAALAALTAMIASGLASDVLRTNLDHAGPWAATAVAMTGVALVVSLVDPRVRFAFGGLYALGVLALSLALHAAGLSRVDLGWYAAVGLSAYALTVALLVNAINDTSVGRSLRTVIRAPVDALPAWYEWAQASMAAMAALLSAWILVYFTDVATRAAAPATAAMVTGAIVLLSYRSPAARRHGCRLAALGLATLCIAEIGCTIVVSDAGAWLDRSVAVLMAATIMALLCRFDALRLVPGGHDWTRAARTASMPLSGVAFSAIVAVLAQECWWYYRQHAVPIHPAAEVMVALVLGAMSAAAVAMAVVPRFDPLALSDDARKWYMYAAEILAGLVGLHVRLVAPELFRGFVQPYWTVLVLVGAFIGAGIAALFERRRMSVLAEPLTRTAMLLPVAPMIGHWLPGAATAIPYDAVLLLAALFYGVLAATHQSWKLATAAALSANGALWYFLHNQGITFLAHPQPWLIPLALAALVAEHINRDRLAESHAAAIRWVALSTIYFSSTIDMFVTGIGNSVVLPLVLMVLSVAGILAGILFRVRSFLYVGVTFVMVLIATLIWYAVVGHGHYWVLYAAGIVLGSAILVLFAVFEKRRNDVMRAFERFRQWQ